VTRIVDEGQRADEEDVDNCACDRRMDGDYCGFG
jgi:hypothetical protein